MDNEIASPNTIRHHWFPREMTSEKRLQKFHTDDVSQTVYLDLGSASDWLKQNSLAPWANQKHYPDLDGGTSSV